jgi:hypothetical protein
VTFRSKRCRTDPPGFIRWEKQPLGPLELALSGKPSVGRRPRRRLRAVAALSAKKPGVQNRSLPFW